MSKYVGAFTTFILCVVIAVAIYGAWKSGPPTTGLSIEILRFENLPGWDEGSDPWIDAFAAFERSCGAVVRKPADRLFAASAVDPDIRQLYGQAADWRKACQAADDFGDRDPRAFFEIHFDPVIISESGDKQGLFTGYFEPILKGNRNRTGPFQTPLLARPADLVMVDLGRFRDSLAGQRIAGRVSGGRLEPFESRAEIEDATEWSDDLAMVWVEDPIDAFFLHIQGSGRVELPDGETIRVNYDGQNGHPYTAIGRILIERGAIAREDVSLQSIQAWLKANPSEAPDVMNANASYVFFREIPVEDPELGPPGAQGVALTPLSSIAVDRLYYPMGTPVWLSLDLNAQVLTPNDPQSKAEPIAFNVLTIAQDTGGAITGAQRADLFWGSGDQAGASAGLMKDKGAMYALIPKSLTSAYLNRPTNEAP